MKKNFVLVLSTLATLLTLAITALLGLTIAYGDILWIIGNTLGVALGVIISFLLWEDYVDTVAEKVNDPEYGQIASGTIGGCTWSLGADGSLYIRGNGEMEDYDYHSLPWGTDIVRSVIISEGVTTIGWHAFQNCKYLTSVTIPDSVKYIRGWAFSGCTALESVTLPANLFSLGLYAFENCVSLKNINIPESLGMLSKGAFSGCYALDRSNIIIPDECSVSGDIYAKED